MIHDDLLDAEIAMFDPFPDLEGMTLEGHVHEVPGNFRPAFLPMPPLWPGDLAAEGRPYPGREFLPRPPHDRWIRQQLYHYPYPPAEAGRLGDPTDAVPYPQRLLLLPYYRGDGWNEGYGAPESSHEGQGMGAPGRGDGAPGQTVMLQVYC